MEDRMCESDWKHFRKLRTVALDRFCQRVLDEIGRLAQDSSKGSHERYLEVYRRLQERDKQLADMFDDVRRSTALLQLARIQSEQLLTDEEFAQFSEGLRATVQRYLDGWSD